MMLRWAKKPRGIYFAGAYCSKYEDGKPVDGAVDVLAQQWWCTPVEDMMLNRVDVYPSRFVRVDACLETVTVTANNIPLTWVSEHNGRRMFFGALPLGTRIDIVAHFPDEVKNG